MRNRCRLDSRPALAFVSRKHSTLALVYYASFPWHACYRCDLFSAMDKRELLSLKGNLESVGIQLISSLFEFAVQRVVSQKANTAAFLSQQEIETYLTLEDDFDCDKLPEHLSSEWRFLPKNYGQIYLGETFSFYTRCTNDSVTELVKDVSLRVDLQLTSNRVIFLGEHKIDTLDSKGTLHELMHHEVKEMGTNV